MISRTQHPVAIPSRSSNPFSTCWTAPGKLRHRFTRDEGVDQLADELLDHRLCQIVGPHGAGKTSLLLALQLELTNRSLEASVTNLYTKDSGVGLPSEAGASGVLLIEGFERLSWPRQQLVILKLMASKRRCVLTTHRLTHPVLGLRAAVLKQMTPSLSLFEELFLQLTQERPTQVSLPRARSVFLESGRDLRETWLRLAVEHERLARGLDRDSLRVTTRWLPTTSCPPLSQSTATSSRA